MNRNIFGHLLARPQSAGFRVVGVADMSNDLFAGHHGFGYEDFPAVIDDIDPGEIPANVIAKRRTRSPNR